VISNVRHMKTLRDILGFTVALLTFAISFGVLFVSCSSSHVNFESKAGIGILLFILVPISLALSVAAYRGITRKKQQSR